jgi:hypothetical protein
VSHAGAHDRAGDGRVADTGMLGQGLDPSYNQHTNGSPRRSSTTTQAIGRSPGLDSVTLTHPRRTMMKSWVTSLAALVLLTTGTRAHFIWIVPNEAGNAAQVVFSDVPAPDKNPALLDKIAHTQLFRRDAAGVSTAIKWTKGKTAFDVDLTGQNAIELGALCTYNVISRGQDQPFLLIYQAKALLPGADVSKPWDKLGLEIIPTGTPNGPAARVLWQGKPLAGAEVVVLAPGGDKEDKAEPLQTGDDGSVALPAGKPGWYGIRAKHTIKEDGEHDGKKYTSRRIYATLVVQLGAEKAAKAEEPAATRLLAEARQMRATFRQFPGFSANIEVNLNGKVYRGQVQVDPSAKVTFTDLDKTAQSWARRTLASVVGHRLDSTSHLKTPCAFAVSDEQHPLGREVRVLNDELHSSYRILDRQISVVNRTMGDRRFTIAMLENKTNAEGKFLPASYVVNYWDIKSGHLVRSEGHFLSWHRVGNFDLPSTIRIVTATPEKSGQDEAGQSAQSLTLSHCQLTTANAATR